MNIIFNPLSNNALTESQLKNNDDIIFDLPGNNIFAKGVKFYGTDTHVEVLDVLNSKRKDAALSANMGRNLDLNKVPYNNQTREPNPPGKFGTIICPTNKSRQGDVPTDNGLLFRTNTGNVADLWISSNDNYIYKRQNNGKWQKIGAGYADSINWNNIINAPNTLPNPKSLTIFDVPYNGSEQVTITPNNYIYKVAKANIGTITDNTAFIGTYYEPSNHVESVNNTPLRYSVSDMWNNWLKPKIENWYEKQSSKVNATLWGNNFTGTETISSSLYLGYDSQIYINGTEILDYQDNILYLGYGTKSNDNSTYIYGGNNITLLTQDQFRFKITTSAIRMNLPAYANSTMNVTNGLYLSSYKIGKLNNAIQSYSDPWQASGADFRFGGSLAATKIYASQGFYHPDYNQNTREIYLLTADGGTTTVNDIRLAVYVEQNNDWNKSFPLVWADEANTSSKYNTYLYKSYDKLTFNPSTSSLTVGSSNNPTSSMWIDGMTKATVNTYSNGYRAWISGSTSSGRLSIGSFGNGSDYTDGNIYFSYATTANINANNNDVNSNIWINPKTNLINSTYYSGQSYTATEGYHLLQKNSSSDVVAGLLTTQGGYYQTTNTAYYGSRPWGCIPIINRDSGVMEIGKYIDFHNDNGGKYDYSTRLQSTGDHQNILNLPSKSGTLALTSDIKDTNTWRPITDNYELGESGISLSSLGSLTLYNDLLGAIPNPTDYYWANVKISASSSTTTSPTVHTLTATRVCAGYNPEIDNSISCSNWFRSSGATGWYNESYGGGIWMNDSNWIKTYGGKSFYCDNQIYSSNSIRMGNILLEHTDEINNSANGNLYLNYRSTGNVSLCNGGGKVGIGTNSPQTALDIRSNEIAPLSVNGAIRLATNPNGVYYYQPICVATGKITNTQTNYEIYCNTDITYNTSKNGSVYKLEIIFNNIMAYPSEIQNYLLCITDFWKDQDIDAYLSKDYNKLKLVINISGTPYLDINFIIYKCKEGLTKYTTLFPS